MNNSWICDTIKTHSNHPNHQWKHTRKQKCINSHLHSCVVGWFLCLEPSWPYVSNWVTVGYWGPHKPGCFTNWRAPEIAHVKFTELLYNLRNLQRNDKQNVYWTLYLASKPTLKTVKQIPTFTRKPWFEGLVGS